MLNNNQTIKHALLITGMALSFQTVAQSCKGDIYGINSGRNATGIVFNLNEVNKSVTPHSIANSSSSAMAFDPDTNRIYYASSPVITEHKLDLSNLGLSEEQLKTIPVQGEQFKTSRLYFIDMETGAHNEVGLSKSLVGLAYDKGNNTLIGASYSSLFSINKETGEATKVADLTNIDGRYYGDLVYSNSMIYLITSSSVYRVSQEDFQLTKITDHYLQNIDGATVNSNGDVIVSKNLINGHGFYNKTSLYKLDLNTGGSCLVANLPVRVNDLTSVTSAQNSCRKIDLCHTENTINMYSQVIDNEHNHNWRTYSFAENTFLKPAVFTSPATFNGSDGGVNRLNNITPNSVDIAFKEWNYHDGNHTTESFNFMALEEGSYTMDDGTLIEVGSFEMGGTQEFNTTNFNHQFSKAPYVFVRVQTYVGSHTLTTRVKNITNTSFDTAFFEQDTYNNSGHLIEKVSFIAIQAPNEGTIGSIQTSNGAVDFELHKADINHEGGQIGKNYYILAEEKSKDAETAHTNETIQVLDIGDVSLAQQVTNNGSDNLSIRIINN